MNEPRYAIPDAVRSRLRKTVATIQRELANLPVVPEGGAALSSDTALRASVRDLVEQLALGPEPDVKECSACGYLSVVAATRCGHCWAKLGAIEASDHSAG